MNFNRSEYGENEYPGGFNPSAAYIETAGGQVFQVLNEEGNDWDEPATAAEYYAWMDEHPEAAR